MTYAPQPWPFAVERRAEIDAHFEDARRERPGIWNGQVLVMHRHRFDRDVLEGAFLQTDFASFMTWRDWGFPEAGVTNCFSMGALRTSDGAWIMGVMAPHTSAAGKIYFPAGTPDPDDVVDGMVDLAGSVIREVAEETGLGSRRLHGTRRLALRDRRTAHRTHESVAGARARRGRCAGASSTISRVKRRLSLPTSGSCAPVAISIR